MANRPLSRYFWRAAAILRHGQACRHFQDVMPGLEIEKPTNEVTGSIFHRGRKAGELLRFADMQEFETISIVGSGPSIRDQDLSALPPGETVLLNGAVTLLPEIPDHQLSLAIEDERFIWQNFSLIEQALSPDLQLFLSPSVIRAICEKDGGWLYGRKIALIDNRERPLGGPCIDQEEASRKGAAKCHNDVAFSLDPDLGIFAVGSVAYSALQIAMARSPKAIHLAGIDLTDTHTPRFYETDETRQWSGIGEASERILRGFALAKNIADDRMIELVNHSPASRLREIGFGFDPRLQIVDEAP